jgi:hypothetical protein
MRNDLARRMASAFRSSAGGLALLAAAATALVVFVPGAIGAGNAGYTTFDVAVLGCVHGSPNGINCNTYATKSAVYANGGPTGGKGLPDGNYYFAVLTPGSQNGGFLQGADGNLSDTTVGATTGDLGSGDAQACRTFSVAGGLIANTYAGATCHHATGVDPQGNFIIALAPFDDTDNPGGVYIMAICHVGAASPSDCKYDAFKVNPPECVGDCTPTPPQDLTVTKSVEPSFKQPFSWGISKKASPSSWTATGGTTKSISYEVDVSHKAADAYGYQVNGTVTVFNPNDFDVSGVTVTDDNNDCKLWSGAAFDTQSLSNQSVDANGTLEIDYLCTLSSNASGSNTATATWDNTVDPNNPMGGTTGSAVSPSAAWNFSNVTPTLINACVDVADDNFLPTKIATLCLGSDGNPATGVLYNPAGVVAASLAAGVSASHHAAASSPPADAYFALTYSKTLTVPYLACANFVNNATFTGSDDTTVQMHGSTQATVTLCPKVAGLTMGYWQNKNGQAQINGKNPTGTCASLYSYLTQFNPFKDLSSSICGTSAGYTQNKSTGSTGIAGYVYDRIKAANASGASMNLMLKAQMLATALDVYFNTSPQMGNIVIDLTKICNMIDNSSTGTGTCGPGGFLSAVGHAFITNGTLPSTDVRFVSLVPSDPVTSGGCQTAVALTSMNVECLLWNAASWSNSGGTIWYGTTTSNQSKATQGLAKNTFDAINNSVAVAAGP